MSDEALLEERLRGRTLRDPAGSTGMSVEGVRLICLREGRKVIEKIESDLLLATRTDEVVAFLVPDHGGEDFDLALSFIQWVVRELTDDGIKVAVHYRPTHNGLVLALEDVTRPRRAK